MNAMNMTVDDGLQWYAVRMVAPGNGHRRTAQLGGEYEAYLGRSGKMQKRRIKGTGKRVFVPEHILKRAGFDVFLPVKKVWKRKNKYHPDKELVAYPLMADWLFVGWSRSECRWADLMALNVVAGVLGAGGRPMAASSDLVNSLKDRWGGKIIVGSPKEHRRMPKFSSGDQLRIVSGPFEDFTGEVVDIGGAGARVMITLFGRQTPVSVPFESADLVGSEATIQSSDGTDLVSKDRLCLRCSGTMISAHGKLNGHHVKCRECGGVGALKSASGADAIARWRQGAPSKTPRPVVEKSG